MRTGRPIPPLTLTNAERETLERWARRAKTAQAVAQRARLILSCAGGRTNTVVARELRLTIEQRQDQQTQTQPGVPVVAAQPSQGPTQAPRQIDPLPIAAQRFEATVRRELLRDKLEGQIALNHPAQARYANRIERPPV